MRRELAAAAVHARRTGAVVALVVLGLFFALGRPAPATGQHVTALHAEGTATK